MESQTVQGQKAQYMNSFLGNLKPQGYEGKDSLANAVNDVYGGAVTVSYAGLAKGAGEVGKLPGPIGYIGPAVNVGLGVATGGISGCSIFGIAVGAGAGIGVAAGLTPGGPLVQALGGYFIGLAVQKTATAACQTVFGYKNGEAPSSLASMVQQTTQAQALISTLGTSILSQVPTTSSPPQTSIATLASQIVQFRPSPDYTGTAGVFTVQSGQTLSKIAANNGITLLQLQGANPQIIDPNSIRSGQIIQLPSNASGYVAASSVNSSSSILNDAAQTSSLTTIIKLYLKFKIVTKLFNINN